MSPQRADMARSFPEFIAMLAMLFATVAFSIDGMLPAMSEIADVLSPDAPNRAQLIVTSFVLGIGVGTFFTGPLSDALGRKPVVGLGMGVYIAAALVAWRAQSLEVLLAARFVQGLGGSAPRVVTLAMIRDLFEGRAMAQAMSFVLSVFIIVPAVAPSIGAGIIALFGWRAVFLNFVVFGVFSGGWLLLRQPETLPPERRRRLTPGSFVSALREILSSKLVIIYIAALSLGFGQMFAFISTAPQLFTETYGRGATFPFWFFGVACFAALANFVNARLVMTLGMRKLATAAFAAQATASFLFLALMLTGIASGPAQFYIFFAYMCTAFFSIGLTFGNLNALAMEPMGHIAGFAAAVVGAISTVAAVVIAIPIGQLYNGTPVPVISGVAVCSTLALVLMRTPQVRLAPNAA